MCLPYEINARKSRFWRWGSNSCFCFCKSIWQFFPPLPIVTQSKDSRRQRRQYYRKLHQIPKTEGLADANRRRKESVEYARFRRWWHWGFDIRCALGLFVLIIYIHHKLTLLWHLFITLEADKRSCMGERIEKEILEADKQSLEAKKASKPVCTGRITRS